MSSILGKIPKFTLKLPSALAKAGRTMSECPLELSISLCDDGSSAKNKKEEQIPLQAHQHDDAPKPDLLLNSETSEKAEVETTEKPDNMEVTCSVLVNGQEEKFSFTLYDFDTRDRTSKDVHAVVIRSICEALNKTLKLPPNNINQTIQLKVAISPDSSSSREGDTKELLIDHPLAWPPDPPANPAPCPRPQPSKLNDCCSAQSANTTSTYLQSSLSEKPPKYSSPLTRSPLVVHRSPHLRTAVPSPKLRPARQCRPVKPDQKNHVRERLQMRMHASDNRHPLEDNCQDYFEDFVHPHKHPGSRDHVPECRDRRNHYLDLAGVESPKRNNLSQPNNRCDSPRQHDPRGADEANNHHHHAIRPDPKYMCPYRLLDRSHMCTKPHRTRECPGPSSPLKKVPNYHPKLDPSGEGSPHLQYRSRMDPQDDLLNLDYDLRDLVPEAKFDWEKPHHRRSKSYDLYENNVTNPGGFYSPKLKPKNTNNNPQNWASILENQKLSNVPLPTSPGHRYRHRHRDKEFQRSMQKVASWIAHEHSNSKADVARHFVRSSLSSPQKQLMERHEHHHLHEHVHHHYHHFFDF